MLYLIQGDSFRAGEELRKIQAALDSDGALASSTVRFDEPQKVRALSAAELQSACLAGSLFGGTNLVIIEGLQARFGGWRRRETRSNRLAADMEPFVDVLLNLPETTTVVLIEEASGVLTQALQGKATVIAFPELKRANDLRTWAEERIKERGLAFAPQALARLLSLVDGKHLGDLANEIDKLSTYALGRSVTVEDVDRLASAAQEVAGYVVTDAVVEGNAGKALKALQSVDVKDSPPIAIMAMLRRQYRQVLLAQMLLGQGLSAPQVGERLGLRGYPLEKTVGYAGRTSAARLELAYRKLLEADVNVKTGVMDVDTVLQALIVELAELQRGGSNRSPAGSFSRN